jgi:hypothetical protein
LFGAAVMLKSGFLDSGGGGDKEKMKKEGSGLGDVVDRSTIETEFPLASSSLSNMVNSISGNGGDAFVEQTAPLPSDVREHVPEQVKPVSLDSYANVTLDASKGVSLNEGGIEPAQYQSFQDFLDAKENHAKALPTSLPQGAALKNTPSTLKQPTTMSTTNGKTVSFVGAIVTSDEPKKHTSNFRTLECSKKANGVDLSVPMKVVEEVNTRFENTLFGYFLGQRLAFPVVDYFVRNAWAKYGIQKVMMSAKGFFFFKFNSKKGVDDIFENGPWLIRNVPIILKPWTLNTNLLKEDLTNTLVWVKFHDLPLNMFSDDGLSLLGTLIGTPKRLDAYTSQMCKESWGRSSFARCMIEVKSDEVLRDSLIVEIPLLDGSGVTIEKIRVEYEWKPPRCDKCKIFTLTNCPKVVISPVQPTKPVNDDFKTVNNKKKGDQGGPTIPCQGGFTKPVMGKQFQYQPKKTPPEPKKVDGTKKKNYDVASSSGKKISTSNQFDALNMDDTDAFGIPTIDTNKDADFGCTMEVNKDDSLNGNGSK